MHSPRLSLRIAVHEVNPDTVVIQLCGELDRATAPALAAQLRRHLCGDARWATVIIDMAETSFLDVGGLNLLLAAHRVATARGITVCLAGFRRTVLRVMHITGTVTAFHLVPDHPERRQRHIRGDRQHRLHRLAVVELGHAPPNRQGRHQLQSSPPEAREGPAVVVAAARTGRSPAPRSAGPHRPRRRSARTGCPRGRPRSPPAQWPPTARRRRPRHPLPTHGTPIRRRHARDPPTPAAATTPSNGSARSNRRFPRWLVPADKSARRPSRQSMKTVRGRRCARFAEANAAQPHV
jgi:anti-anti-sigma factor